jgi:hydroxyethylthiazole kinase-like uncharacterized protein yjeF
MGAADGPPRTALELAIAERNAVALGVPVERLMDEAGRVVAEAVLAHVPEPSGRVTVLAGAGNNGGDGCAVVHHLIRAGRHPQLWMVAGSAATRSIAARRWFDRVAGSGEVREGPPKTTDLTGTAVIVDAMLGTGQSGPLREPYLAAVDAAGASGAPVLSVDVPTGLGSPHPIHPRWTVTLSAPKVGLTASNSGTIVVRSIGIPEAAFDRTGPGDYLAYPASSPRGRSVRIAVIGGGPYAGAPALAALAALRAGAERATVLTPTPAADAVRGFSPNLIVAAHGNGWLRPTDVDGVLAAIRETRIDAVVVGMGLGRSAETLGAARRLLAELPGTTPVVVDADALDALPERVDPARPAPVLATPNEGEFARVFGATPDEDLAGRQAQVASAAAARGVAIVLKGREDVIALGDRVATTGPHPAAMNVGGSGDVLAGVIGRLLGGHVPAVAAARLATRWLDDAAHHAASVLGDGLLATDLLDQIPVALLGGLRTARLG